MFKRSGRYHLCPHCRSKTDYIPKYEQWYCWECEEYSEPIVIKQKTVHQVYPALALALLILAAFSGGYLANLASDDDDSQPDEGITVIDGAGRTVTVPDNPGRIVSLAASATETIFALDAGEKLVGRDKYSTYPSEAKDIKEVGSGFSPNLEMIVGLEPDLVLAWAYSRDALSGMENDLCVVYIDPSSVDGALDTITLIGTIIGRAPEAEGLTSGMRGSIDEITGITDGLNRTRRPLVYYELSTPMKTTGPGTFTNELIFMAGGINLAADEPVRYPILSSEYIIDRNPDIIVIVDYGASVDEVKDRDGWGNINAVENDRIYRIDTNLVTANPRIVLGMEQFAEWFHPDLFEGDD